MPQSEKGPSASAWLQWCSGCLAYPLIEPGAFTQLRNVRTIVVGEHLVAKDGVSDLGGVEQIHFDQTRLQACVLRFVVLERIEQKGGGRLNQVVSHEQIHDLASKSTFTRRSTKVSRKLQGCSRYLIEVNKRAALGTGDHGRK